MDTENIKLIGEVVGLCVLGYALGAFLPAYWFSIWFRKQDIREMGSSNPGTMNAWYQLGPGYGIVTFLYDALKGIGIFWFAGFLGLPAWAQWLVAAFAWSGHLYPWYLKFRGGQGVATALGLALWGSYEIGRARPEFFGWLAVPAMLFITIVILRKQKELSSVVVLPPVIALVVWLGTGSVSANVVAGTAACYLWVWIVGCYEYVGWGRSKPIVDSENIPDLGQN